MRISWTDPTTWYMGWYEYMTDYRIWMTWDYIGIILKKSGLQNIWGRSMKTYGLYENDLERTCGWMDGMRL